MMQKSLLSFFKTATPVAASSTTTNATNNGLNADPMLTPVKKTASGSLDAPLFLDSSPLFSTDEAILKGTADNSSSTVAPATHKRKTVDFEDGSPIAYQDESRSVKKFAAAVEKLSLGTPVRKLDLFNIDPEDRDEEPLGARRSVGLLFSL
jgi:hypothetical protein